MPRKGRRSEAAKKRWRTLDLEDLQGSQPDVAKPRTSPPTAQAWIPTQSPEKKVEGTPTERTGPARRQPRRAAPTLEVDAPAESSPVPLEDHVRDDSCQASSLEPCASGPPVQTVRATHCQADYRYECIAVFRDRDGRFGVFDSHSRNSAGLPYPNGTAVVMTFSNLTLMVENLYKLFENRGPYATYEFVPVSFVSDDIGDAPPPALSNLNISPGSTQASPGVEKPESTSDEEEMPAWLAEVGTDEDCVKMSLPMSKLMNMAPDEENVWMTGLPEKYLVWNA
ncbi:uncharacterized protein LOC124866087 isoform X1 [Girardinichthys multiradiatus]|uniref:uncharacterized protein LOC124866087 isoform X1 n=1 Tax=Girardinichthys multiradiatus TaxID=208333 RepID=UPI001FAB68EB|nr:uncharacterized protein LOC124866087 isoform X1 [Girardinichthys multiradiatus]